MSHRAPAVLTLALALGLAVAAGVASPVNAAPGWSITSAFSTSAWPSCTTGQH